MTARLQNFQGKRWHEKQKQQLNLIFQPQQVQKFASIRKHWLIYPVRYYLVRYVQRCWGVHYFRNIFFQTELAAFGELDP